MSAPGSKEPRCEYHALVARQPIFDAQMRPVAYELLYRAAVADAAALTNDGVAATLQVITNSIFEIGLDRLLGTVPAHINFPRELIVQAVALPLPAERVVIEVLEDVRGDADVLNGLRVLRARGHSIALDDFSPEQSDLALLDVADTVKIDVAALRGRALEDTLALLRPRGLPLIAEKIETLEQLELCRQAGFGSFQGFFLHRPETFCARRIPTSRLATLRILTELQAAEGSVLDVERYVARDLGITYKLLRCINSSYFNLPREISSLRQAIVLLGLDNLRRLCALVMLSGFDDRPVELLMDTLIRARMCELLAHAAGIRDTGPFFVTGMFSMIDTLLGLPLDEALRELPLAQPVVAALTEGAGEPGAALRCAQHYERCDWSNVSFQGLSGSVIRSAYLAALEWAEDSRSLLHV